MPNNKITAEKTVDIIIPKSRENHDDLFVSVNERTWQIKRGQKVSVPLCVAEVIKCSEAMTEEALDFEAEASKGA